jgi:hypothetical protein
VSNRSIPTIAACWLLAVSNAQAGTQLFQGSWVVKAFGNERTGGTGESEFYSANRVPLGAQCNSNQPRCPYESTPTDGEGNFAPLGGSRYQALYCAPWYNWAGHGTTMRPTLYAFYSNGWRRLMPPLPRNPAFFTPSGNPHSTHCGPRSTSLGGYGSLGGGPGVVQVGRPITGSLLAATTGTAMGGFSFPAALSSRSASGFRATGVVGEFAGTYPYLYSYTYVTMRNASGFFGPGGGLGDAYLRLPRVGSGAPNAHIQIKQGAHKFGGVMKMLGFLTAKVCYYRAGGCSRGFNNWRYDVVGTTGYRSSGGAITKGYHALTSTIHFNSGIGAFSTVQVVGSRFGWTTGSVTVTAVGRGPHKTVHYAHGYDNRTTTSMGAQTGTIQLVSPLLTQWLQPAVKYETGGIGILKLRFVPEPRIRWALVAGAGALILLYGLKIRNVESQRPSHRD